MESSPDPEEFFTPHRILPWITQNWALQKAAEPQVAKAAPQEATQATQKSSPPAPEPAIKSKPAASSSTANRAAGDEYLVPEYSQHNEYSFYDIHADMDASRIGQPRAERKI